ncbi:MAG: FtsX-like permease family protein [Balneolaceae bacterium]|nr:FtsX-like permease family protein [Balneolaceae bacterium]
MFKNYIKLAFRNLFKHKTHTLINVGGLTLGIVCSTIIFLLIQFDLSFDTWHNDSDQIYRVVKEDSEFGDISYTPGSPYPLTEAIRNDVEGLEQVAMVNVNYSNTPVVLSESENGRIKKFTNKETAFVDPEYFGIFTYEWVAGSKETVLNRPNTAVLTESFARKLFGKTEVTGQQFVLSIGAKIDLEVTGIVKDPPINSDFPFTLFITSNTKSREGVSLENEDWGSTSSSTQTYVKLKEGRTPENINRQFDPIITKYRDAERAEVTEYFLQPLSEIHFDSRFEHFGERVEEKKALAALGIVGFFLLITACINFVNLNTAIAVSRSKEVGLRKTFGGSRLQLTFHFLGETAFVTGIAIVLGIGLTEVLLTMLEPLLGYSPQISLLTNPQAMLFLVILFFAITIAAGWYPARKLSGFNPIEAVRNKMNTSYGQGLALRRGLIIVQFTITQILIIATVIIASQLRYFKNQDLGFTKEAIVEVEIPLQHKQKLDTFKNELLRESSIRNVTYSNSGAQSGNTWGGNYILTDDSSKIENDAHVKFIDHDFVDTYELSILAGTNVADTDTVSSYLVNEMFAQQTGYGDDYAGLIGKEIRFWGKKAPIVGVVKNFNTSSLHSQLKPVVLTTRPAYHLGAIKINMQQSEQALAAIRQAYTAAFPDVIFDYSFLDDNIAKLYEGDQRAARIMNTFTVIAILIGCLGLFGLVSYMAATRVKEIGVRKVLGADVIDILKIFAGEVSLLTGISFALAAPVSWYLMQKWLADFAYRIEIGASIFAVALGVTLLIAVLTIGYKSIQAAISNPINSLKSE